MAPRRHNIGASRRRRRDEEGEDEGSVDGELEDDSLSEGSAGTQQDEDDADAEGSDESDDEVSTSAPGDIANGQRVNGRVSDTSQEVGRRFSSFPGKGLLNSTTMSDTEAMLNGLKVSDTPSDLAEIHFDDMKGGSDLKKTGRTPSAPPTEPRRDIPAERKRREPEKYSKERDENPAIVPTRGAFFLHDKRSTEAGSNGHRSSKSKSRPYGLIVDGNVRRHTRPVASGGVWTHDLHETVAGEDPPAVKASVTSSTFPSNPPKPVPTAPRSSPPNRSFSSTTVIGNVPVVVSLPGMARPVSFPAVLKKQHTRLPQHRPPLRRDKPVRISLPERSPHYIFPATERSFIFIPRALRPNQQAYRGRGRGGFYGGRRPSVYSGSTYTPSVAMSRRSSLGKAPSQDGYHSPAGSVFSRPTMVTTDNGKPVVRLPPPRPPGGIMPPAPVGVPPSTLPAPLPQPPHLAYRESRPAPIPMHQPRPQKAVSVADIETPATFPFNPPQPQQEQPFHHQVPVPANGSVYGPDGSAHPPATPLSHIPERAILAQPFQPYGFQQPQPYYPTAYPPGTVYYPGSGTEFPPYNAAVGPGASVAPYPPGQTPFMVSGAPSSTDQPSQSGTVAHEAGGTVYFYDTNQMYQNSSYGMPAAPGAGGVVGMGGMMTPPGTTYYYPPPQGGVYYGSQ